MVNKRILDLFSGSKSVSNVFKDYGWDVLTLDYDPKLNPDICKDILDVSISELEAFKPDFIWASPDCSCFSVASIGTHWTGGKYAYIPKTSKAVLGIRILRKTLEIIEQINPKNYVIENPRGLMRKMEELKDYPLKTVCYCQYGDTRMKPTDIWCNVNFPAKMCHNGNKDHERSPRGSKTGTQGLKNYYYRSIVPRGLVEEIINYI